MHIYTQPSHHHHHHHRHTNIHKNKTINNHRIMHIQTDTSSPAREPGPGPGLHVVCGARAAARTHVINGQRARPKAGHSAGRLPAGAFGVELLFFHEDFSRALIKRCWFCWCRCLVAGQGMRWSKASVVQDAVHKVEYNSHTTKHAHASHRVCLVAHLPLSLSPPTTTKSKSPPAQNKTLKRLLKQKVLDDPDQPPSQQLLVPLLVTLAQQLDWAAYASHTKHVKMVAELHDRAQTTAQQVCVFAAFSECMRARACVCVCGLLAG